MFKAGVPEVFLNPGAVNRTACMPDVGFTTFTWDALYLHRLQS
jgi:hypothetical protein